MHSRVSMRWSILPLVSQSIDLSVRLTDMSIPRFFASYEFIRGFGMLFVRDGIISVADYNSTRVGGRRRRCRCRGHFHNGITRERFELSSWNFVWWLVMTIYYVRRIREPISPMYTRPDTSLKIMEDLLVVRNFFFWHTKTHIWRENGLDNHIRGAHQAYKKGWWWWFFYIFIDVSRTI